MTQRRWSGTRATVVAAIVIVGAAGCGSTSPGAPTDSGPASASASAGSTAASSSTAPWGSAPTGAPSSGGSSGGSSDITAPTIPPGEAPTGAPIVPGSGQAGGRVAELTGTVEAGVESGCVVLTDAGGAVLANLIGLDLATTPVGTQVVVTGTFQRDLMTTCQQGAPFEVTSVKKR